LISRPWHVRRWRDACLLADLQWLAKQTGANEHVPHGVSLVPGAGFHAAAWATIMPGVVIDCSGGPVYLDAHALVRPGAVVSGPVYVGPHAQVLDRAVIRGFTAIGPWCKVAGEVGGTIFQAFSNKGHDGYLGDSYVGEWVNLGAGTTNSNLLNTYGEVICRALETPAGPPGSNERTGETFLGCVLGDHVKTAICTRIMTGSIVGTGTMHAATAPISGTTPAMQWATDAGTKAYRFDKFMEVARAAMARRKVTPSAGYEQSLRELTTG
jgi:UDP-N-acetylglucosamine diphosphorylase/glucosamine-1-phosphate N-acetyltransferase